MQPSDSMFSQLLGRMNEPMSEDGLYLNIWSPAADGKKRPVLFWIHGGAFLFGSGSFPWYDGTAFAKHGDVVVVTINYRMSVFGFLYLGDAFGETYAQAGNLGILDQVAALRWVKRTLRRSAVIRTTLRFLANQPERQALACCCRFRKQAGCFDALYCKADRVRFFFVLRRRRWL